MVIAVSGSGVNASVLSVKRADLPADMVAGNYALPNIRDPEGLAQVLRNCLEGLSCAPACRAALSLPDGVFRVQTLDFDQLPRKAADRERLIRWRIEKAAAFDVSETLLRYEILRRQDSGLTVLVCVAKKSVITQYEAVLTGLGLEPWSVGLSSFHALNFYGPYMVRKSAVSALTHVADDSFTTIVVENGGVRFYRFKEMKRGSSNEVSSRLAREIEDSLHFYAHMDRSQQAEVSRLFLTGESSVRDNLAGELTGATSLDVEVLTPASVLPTLEEAGPEMAAALGAGSSL